MGIVQLVAHEGGKSNLCDWGVATHSSHMTFGRTCFISVGYCNTYPVQLTSASICRERNTVTDRPYAWWWWHLQAVFILSLPFLSICTTLKSYYRTTNLYAERFQLPQRQISDFLSLDLSSPSNSNVNPIDYWIWGLMHSLSERIYKTLSLNNGGFSASMTLRQASHRASSTKELMSSE